MIRAVLIAMTLCPLVALPSALAGPGDEVIDIVAPFEIGGTDPSIAGDLFLKMNVAETLVGTDATGEPIPGLAAAWRMSEDARQWRFRLRPGVRFHDGTPLTAQAVVDALGHARAKPGILAKAPITAIEATGDEATGDEVVFSLSEPFAPLPAFLAQYTTAILAPAAYDERGQAVRVIGTGPYRIASLQAPQKMAVERFEGYWGDRPAIRSATYLAVGRSETRALMAESGDADFVLNLDPASRMRLSRNPRVTVHAVAIPRSILLKLNVGDALLGDPRVRQALSLAIDRDGIADAILRYPAAATQLFPPSVAAWHHPGLAPLAHDVAKARALLAEAGWTPGSDGILARDGRRFSMTLLTYPDRPELPLAAAVLQDQFRDIGVEIAVESTNSSEIPARHQNGTLQIALAARNFALVPDPIGTVLQDYPPRGGDWGAMNWTNPEFHQAISALTKLADRAWGAPLREKAVSILQAELPVIPVAWYQQSAAVSKRLEGARLDPFERDFGISGMRWAR